MKVEWSRAEQIIDWIESLCRYAFRLLIAATQFIKPNRHLHEASFSRENEVLSSRYDGFNLTGTKSITMHMSRQGAMVVGGSGTGKSQCVQLPSIVTTKASKIINDPAGELLEATGHLLDKHGYRIIVLDFARPEESAGYNPLWRATTHSLRKKIASLLAWSRLGGGNDPFWLIEAETLLTTIFNILYTQPEEYQTLRNALHLLQNLQANPEGVDLLVARNADDQLLTAYKSFLKYESKVQANILSSALACLSQFSDPDIAAVTSYDTIDLRRIRQEPTAIFIRNRIADAGYYGTISSLFFEDIFRFIMEDLPKENDLPVMLLLDEVSSMKSLKTLPIAAANLRKYNAGLMLVLQSYTQLEEMFGRYDAEAIKANMYTKIYFHGMTLEQAREIESLGGQYHYYDEDDILRLRSLITADEARRLPDDKALILVGNRPPIRATMTPFYTQRRFRKQGTFQPHTSNSRPPTTPLLTLPQPEKSKS